MPPNYVKKHSNFVLCIIHFLVKRLFNLLYLVVFELSEFTLPYSLLYRILYAEDTVHLKSTENKKVSLEVLDCKDS